MSTRRCWLVLTMWRDIEHTIKICYSYEEAKKEFKDKTEWDWDKFTENNDELWEEFSQSNWGGSQIQEHELKGVKNEICL